MYRCMYQGLVINGKSYSIGEAVPETLSPNVFSQLLRTGKITPDKEYQKYLSSKLEGLTPLAKTTEVSEEKAVSVSTKKK
jgi:hypothetical protein